MYERSLPNYRMVLMKFGIGRSVCCQATLLINVSKLPESECRTKSQCED